MFNHAMHNSQVMEPVCVSINGSVQKENVVYTQNGVYSAIKKNEIMSLVGKRIN